MIHAQECMYSVMTLMRQTYWKCIHFQFGFSTFSMVSEPAWQMEPHSWSWSSITVTTQWVSLLFSFCGSSIASFETHLFLTTNKQKTQKNANGFESKFLTLPLILCCHLWALCTGLVGAETVCFLRIGMSFNIKRSDKSGGSKLCTCHCSWQPISVCNWKPRLWFPAMGRWDLRGLTWTESDGVWKPSRWVSAERWSRGLGELIRPCWQCCCFGSHDASSAKPLWLAHEWGSYIQKIYFSAITY